MESSPSLLWVARSWHDRQCGSNQLEHGWVTEEKVVVGGDQYVTLCCLLAELSACLETETLNQKLVKKCKREENRFVTVEISTLILICFRVAFVFSFIRGRLRQCSGVLLQVTKLPLRNTTQGYAGYEKIYLGLVFLFQVVWLNLPTT